MLNADPLFTRPTLTSPHLLSSALERFRRSASSPAEVWRMLTESYTVDLDAVAVLLPSEEPEPTWLPARD
ncbi:hypothetical protein [Methylobacterium nigriterrae]|uniref:hypothetical protein n=1 Tax=Methylobacterium nigriterrae TaxID=3127512 RepID=UPI0030136025